MVLFLPLFQDIADDAWVMDSLISLDYIYQCRKVAKNWEILSFKWTLTHSPMCHAFLIICCSQDQYCSVAWLAIHLSPLCLNTLVHMTSTPKMDGPIRNLNLYTIMFHLCLVMVLIWWWRIKWNTKAGVVSGSHTPTPWEEWLSSSSVASTICFITAVKDQPLCFSTPDDGTHNTTFMSQHHAAQVSHWWVFFFTIRICHGV